MLSPIGLAYVHGFWLALPLGVAAAWRWGSAAARTAGLALALAFLASFGVLHAEVRPFAVVAPGLVIIDLGLVVMLAALAMRSREHWLICATSFQTIATLGHLSKTVLPGMSQLAYGLMEGASGWPTLIALLIGTWRYRRQPRTTAARIIWRRCWTAFPRSTRKAWRAR